MSRERMHMKGPKRGYETEVSHSKDRSSSYSRERYESSYPKTSKYSDSRDSYSSRSYEEYPSKERKSYSDHRSHPFEGREHEPRSSSNYKESYGRSDYREKTSHSADSSISWQDKHAASRSYNSFKSPRDSFPSRDRESYSSRPRGSFLPREHGSFSSRGRDSFSSRGRDSFSSRGRDSFSSRGRDSFSSRGRDNFPSRGRGFFSSRGSRGSSFHGSREKSFSAIGDREYAITKKIVASVLQESIRRKPYDDDYREFRRGRGFPRDSRPFKRGSRDFGRSSYFLERKMSRLGPTYGSRRSSYIPSLESFRANDRLGSRKRFRDEFEERRGIDRSSSPKRRRSKSPEHRSPRKAASAERRASSAGSTKEEKEEKTSEPQPKSEIRRVKKEGGDSNDSDIEKEWGVDRSKRSKYEEKKDMSNHEPFVELECPHCPGQKSITFNEYRYHLDTRGHRSNLDRLTYHHSMVLRKIRLQQRTEQRETDDKWREEKPDEFKNTVSKYCNVCKLAFKCMSDKESGMNGIEKHKSSKLHKTQEKYLFPHCVMCRMSFPSRMVYEYHIASIRHLRMKAMAKENETKSGEKDKKDDTKKDEDLIKDFITMDSVEAADGEDIGSEKDEIRGNLDDIEWAKEDAKKETSDDEHDDTGVDLVDVQHASDDEDEMCGREYLVQFEGFYCKLCHKAFKVEDTEGSVEDVRWGEKEAELHCSSRAHVDNYHYLDAEGMLEHSSQSEDEDDKEARKGPRTPESDSGGQRGPKTPPEHDRVLESEGEALLRSSAYEDDISNGNQVDFEEQIKDEEVEENGKSQ